MNKNQSCKSKKYHNTSSLHGILRKHQLFFVFSSSSQHSFPIYHTYPVSFGYVDTFIPRVGKSPYSPSPAQTIAEFGVAESHTLVLTVEKLVPILYYIFDPLALLFFSLSTAVPWQYNVYELFVNVIQIRENRIEIINSLIVCSFAFLTYAYLLI